MFKIFLKDTFLYAIGVFAIRLINFILMPFLTRMISPSEYGIITLLLTISPIILYIITLQISQAIPKYCANNPDNILKKTYISTGFWYVFFSYIIFYLLISLFPKFSKIILGLPHQEGLFNLALINICLFGLFTFLETQLRWDKKVIEYTIVSVSIMLFSLILIVTFIFMNMGLKGYFIGSAIAQFIGCVMAYYYGRDNYKFIFSKQLLKQMLNFTFPLCIAAVGGYLYANLNQWLIRFFCDFHALGIYGVASRFASIVSILLGCISLSITPIIYAEYKKPEMPHFISFLFRICLLFALWCAAIFMVFNQQILSIIVGKDFFNAGKYIPLLLLSYTFSSFYIFTPGQWIFNKTREMAAVNLIAGLINLLLALILIKTFLISGAVIALFIASLFQLFLNIYFSNKYYPINFRLINISIALLLFLLLYCVKCNILFLIIFMIASLLLLISKKDILIYIINIHPKIPIEQKI